MHIRTANQTDKPRLTALLRQLHTLHVNLRPDIYRQPDDGYFAEEAEKFLSDENIVTFVSEENGMLTGYAFCALCRREDAIHVARRILRIQHLAVDDRFRRTGIGQRLLARAEEFAAENGCASVELSVWAENYAAVDFYAASGYTQRVLQLEKIISTSPY